jgi:ferredoxin
MTHVIFDLCINDGACAEVCPMECIVPADGEAGWGSYYVDPDTCTDCGACVSECPVDAILPAEQVPAKYKHAIQKNAIFFSQGPGYDAVTMR